MVTKDKQHLQWIYDRMIKVHKEKPNYDYMIKFKDILKEKMKKQVKISLQTSLVDKEVVDLIDLKTNKKIGSITRKSAESISRRNRKEGNKAAVQLIIEF